METLFDEMNNDEMLLVEGGNPVVVYGIIAAGKYIVIPAAKIVAEAAIAGFVVKGIGDLIK